MLDMITKVNEVVNGLVWGPPAILCIFGVGLLWSIAETFNGLMAIPNLIALFLLSGGTVVKFL